MAIATGSRMALAKYSAAIVVTTAASINSGVVRVFMGGRAGLEGTGLLSNRLMIALFMVHPP